MIEVEAKAKISNPAVFRKKAALIGKYKGKEKKIDDYYTLDSLVKYPQKSLRIRARKGHHEVNFKQRISYVKGVHAKNETEFIVEDIKRFLALIDEFGFKKWLRKEKETELYEIKKNFHIELNNVRGLGYFIEVEYLSDLNGVSKARNEVLRVIRLLEIKNKDIVKEGYTKILWNKKH